MGLNDKESIANVGDTGSVPGSGGFPGEGNGNLLQYSCLGNPMDGRAWQGSMKSQRVRHESATKQQRCCSIFKETKVKSLSRVQPSVTPWTVAY